MKLALYLLLVSFSLRTYAGDGRALLVVIDLAEQTDQLKSMYRAETKTAVRRIQRITKGHYDRLVIHHRKEATRENFLQSISDLTNDPAIKTIDTIIYLHGKNGSYVNGPSICFVGESPCASVSEVSQQVRVLTQSNNKLRALYSDACWGKYHLDAWIAAGYKVANGTIGVDANHSLDLRKFLKKWVSGETYENSIKFANSARLTTLVDRLIEDANSIKVTKGNTEIRILDDLK